MEGGIVFVFPDRPCAVRQGRYYLLLRVIGFVGSKSCPGNLLLRLSFLNSSHVPVFMVKAQEIIPAVTFKKPEKTAYH
jgi:hypothetical protein